MTTTVSPTLEKEDVQALRQADLVSFHTYDGQTYVRATKRNKGSTFTSEYDSQREIPVGVVWTDYGAMFTSQPRFTNGFTMLHTPSYNERWQTILRLVKAGDRLALHWLADNSNGYSEAAHLHLDELEIIITRDKPNGKRDKLVFLLDVKICEDNSARMVNR